MVATPIFWNHGKLRTINQWPQLLKHFLIFQSELSTYQMVKLEACLIVFATLD